MTTTPTHRFGHWAATLALSLAVAGLLTASGCKKAPKKGDNKGTSTPAADSMEAKRPAADAMKANRKVKEAKRAVAGQPAAPMAGGGMAATPPATPPRPAGPVKVQLLVGLNAKKLRKTFLWKKLMDVQMVKTVLAGDTYQAIKKALGKDPLQLVDEAHFVMAGASLSSITKPEHLGVAVSGGFDASATLKKIFQVPLGPGLPKPRLVKINGKDAIRGKGKAGDDFVIIALNKNTLAMCSSSLADVFSKGDLTGGSAGIAAQKKTVAKDALAWVLFGAVKVPLGSAGAMPALSALSKIQSGSVVLHSGKGSWKLVNRLDVTTAQAAQGLVQFVSMMKMALGKASAGAAGAPGAPPAALGAVLKRMKVTTQGQVLIATLEMPQAEVKKLLGSLLSKL